MVALDMLNTRLKDFYDLWAIANAFAFDGAVLTRAIAATFERRQTPLPQATPIALTAAYAEERKAQWAAFLRRTEVAVAPEPFPDVQMQIETFVMPPVTALARGDVFDARWRPGGPWQE